MGEQLQLLGVPFMVCLSSRALSQKACIRRDIPWKLPFSGTPVPYRHLPVGAEKDHENIWFNVAGVRSEILNWSLFRTLRWLWRHHPPTKLHGVRTPPPPSPSAHLLCAFSFQWSHSFGTACSGPPVDSRISPRLTSDVVPQVAELTVI